MSRVLVVEDHPINLELATALLEGLGCEVVAARSAEQALALAATAQPDLIIMDVQLPQMDGYEVTRRLKADPRTAGTPVVAVTAQVQPGEEQRARAAGCAAYVAKPLDAERFQETVRRLLGDAR
jgi:two-component system cell cycle response regulator DivK